MNSSNFPQDNAFGSEANDSIGSEAPKELERDDMYYFDIIVFEIESTLFRVPRNGFQVPGSTFDDMFSLPGPGENGEQVEGTDDKHPLFLDGVSKTHFRGFLRVMYPFKGTASYEEWIGALHLATKWNFTEIREKSIKALSDLLTERNVASKILLAKEYFVKRWLVDGYTQLVTQVEALDVDQLCDSNIDALTIAKLLSIRESEHIKLHTNRYCNRCGRNMGGSSEYSVTGENGQGLVSEKFALELSRM